ncbi:DHA1 family inner membrane transport protein [Nocardiopsis arvandica]|uniref:DHA1 family inner membrane transport protein n=1 Tax=Nocardiopsis sinuspersici TaxID=501010 RepID=A0A7Y9XGL6_9ACTN|nr:MFS transporter [Nocardiopsis sinuspersici]NYH55328.1 DHA1 family inner membrane transport protein [Nocardiopsis sinuspersici]
MHDEATLVSRKARSSRLSFVVYALALGTFLMLTTEFVVAGILPDIAADVQVSVAQAGMLITVFAVGMIVGAPLMAMLTLRMPQRVTLMLALGVFALGHVVVAAGSEFGVLFAARFLTALATGAFWAVAAVVATRVAGPGSGSRAVGVVNAGGMLATVLGVPLGAFAGQLVGWRGTFWALAVLAVVAMPMIARHVPRGGAGHRSVSVRSELAALRSGRLWLVLAACAATTGGVLAAYSYVAPLLTEQTGIPSNLVPLVLAGFGVGSLAGSVLGGRLGDTRPHTATIAAPLATALILLTLCFVSSAPIPTTVLLVLLGLFGLGANPVLISLAVRYAAHAPTLGSSLSVAAFNFGTAAASWIGGVALGTGLGALGPVAVGTAIAALTPIPAAALALIQRRRGTGVGPEAVNALS